jgi:periplasmic protein TonB
MRLVELNPPKAPVTSPSPAPATHTTPAPVTPAKTRQAADPRPHVSPQSRTTPSAPSGPSVPSRPDMQSVQSVVPAQSAPTSEEPKAAAEPPAHTAAPAGERANAAPSGDASAHAIAQPLPELPDDLREQAYQTVATARFAIHVDGSVDVELIKPTSNPRLNQILLETLRKWRFFPAMQAGHPVESRQDIRVHFNVNQDVEGRASGLITTPYTCSSPMITRASSGYRTAQGLLSLPIVHACGSRSGDIR